MGWRTTNRDTGSSVSLMNLIMTTFSTPSFDPLLVPGRTCPPSSLPSALVDDTTSLRYSSLVPSCLYCLRVTQHCAVTFVTVFVTVHKWPAHVFFCVCSTPGSMSSPDMVPNFTVSQWDHASSMVECHDHVSTASSQRDCVSQSTLSHYNLANRCGWRFLSHSSPLSETSDVSGNSSLKNTSY